jgi:hypothetical protein
MNNTQKILLGAVLLGASCGMAQAALVLDSGVPNMTGRLALDATDYAAAEFHLGAGQIITGIQAYIAGGNSGNPGDAFTIALYAADGPISGNAALPGTLEWSGIAAYQADGWTGLDNLSIGGLTEGNYWAAFEVADSSNTAGLELPVVSTGGTAPALAYAFNAGSGYQLPGASGFGVQVSAVPVPAALWLMGSALMPVGALARRKPA